MATHTTTLFLCVCVCVTWLCVLDVYRHRVPTDLEIIESLWIWTKKWVVALCWDQRFTSWGKSSDVDCVVIAAALKWRISPGFLDFDQIPSDSKFLISVTLTKVTKYNLFIENSETWLHLWMFSQHHRQKILPKSTLLCFSLRSKGVVLNISSASGMYPVPLLTVYSATKVCATSCTCVFELFLEYWSVFVCFIKPAHPIWRWWQ